MPLTRPTDPASQLTVREHFAALALQGLLASGAAAETPDVAELAVAHADELIAALNCPPVPPAPEPVPDPVPAPSLAAPPIHRLPPSPRTPTIPIRTDRRWKET